MQLTVFDNEFDCVIDSAFIVAKTNFESAINFLVPMINKYQEQRYILKSNLYKKLEEDLKNGCIMPPITIAIQCPDLNEIKLKSNDDITLFIINNIDAGYVLDGIQRLNTLKRIYEDNETVQSPIYLNILISDSKDKMLYRMVTLNNGQKPMSARHQIEVLADTIYDFEALNISILSEKEQKLLGRNALKELTFTKENIIKAYMAFISDSINIDNQKIISDKLDELITNKILEANIPRIDLSFTNVIELIKKLCESYITYKWFSNINNMIGFCSAVSKSYEIINNQTQDTFSENITILDSAFKKMNASKINVGTARRKTARVFVEKFHIWSNLGEADLIDEISMII